PASILPRSFLSAAANGRLGRCAGGGRIEHAPRAGGEGSMYRVIAVVLLAVALITPASAVAPPPAGGEFASLGGIQKWTHRYRGKPNPARVPAAVRALSQLGVLKDPENSAIYVGFIAGIIGGNPGKAEDLIGKMLPLTPQDQWVIVRAIAYSGHPAWKELMTTFVPRMPMRAVMSHEYVSGKLPTLDAMALETPKPTFFQGVKGYFNKPPPPLATLDRSPEMLDVLWGYYFATGAYKPVVRIVSMLPWSTDRDSVDKLTLGSTAKYTLANYAARDAALLETIRRM